MEAVINQNSSNYCLIAKKESAAKAISVELLQYILQFLPGSTIVQTRLICKEFKIIADSDYLWQMLVNNEYGLPNILPSVAQDLYKKMFLQNKTFIKNLQIQNFKEHFIEPFAYDIEDIADARRLAFSAPRLFLLTQKNKIETHDFSSNEKKLFREVQMERDTPYSISIQGDELFVEGTKGTIHAYNLLDSSLRIFNVGPTEIPATFLNGEMVVLPYNDHKINVYSSSTGKLLRTFIFPKEHTQAFPYKLIEGSCFYYASVNKDCWVTNLHGETKRVDSIPATTLERTYITQKQTLITLDIQAKQIQVIDLKTGQEDCYFNPSFNHKSILACDVTDRYLVMGNFAEKNILVVDRRSKEIYKLQYPNLSYLTTLHYDAGYIVLESFPESKVLDFTNELSLQPPVNNPYLQRRILKGKRRIQEA